MSLIRIPLMFLVSMEPFLLICLYKLPWQVMLRKIILMHHLVRRVHTTLNSPGLWEPWIVISRLFYLFSCFFFPTCFLVHILCLLVAVTLQIDIRIMNSQLLAFQHYLTNLINGTKIYELWLLKRGVPFLKLKYSICFGQEGWSNLRLLKRKKGNDVINFLWLTTLPVN